MTSPPAVQLRPTRASSPSLARANLLLLAFSESSPELGVMELARRVGLKKSTASRFVTTLHRLGLLERADDGRRYRLALRVFELGMLAVRSRPAFAQVERVLDRLAAETRETAALAVLADRDVVFVDRADAADRSPLALGRRYPAACCAAGKVLLAGLRGGDVDARTALSGTVRPDGEPVPALRRAELASVREAGYALDWEELFAGIASVAAPVLDRRGAVAAAVVLTGPTSRLERSSLPGFAPVLERAAAEISRRSGYRPRAVRRAC